MEIDDTDNGRSKSTKKISWVHKLKDKATGGYVMGQNLIFLVLVTPTITFPVGFSFYMPDPKVTAWRKEFDRLKKLGVAAKERPLEPSKDENYPTKQEIALRLLKQFQEFHPDIRIRVINADALYGTKHFFSGAAKIYPKAQIISQIRKNQNILFRNKKILVGRYFDSHPGIPQNMTVRGDKKIVAVIGSGRFHVCSHGRKLYPNRIAITE